MNSMMKTFVVTLVLTGLAAQASAQMRGPGPSNGPGRNGPGPQPNPGGGNNERGNRGGNNNDDRDRERREREERERQDRQRQDQDRQRQDEDRRRQDQDRQRQEQDRQRQEQERARQDQQRRAEEDRRREEERRNNRPMPGPVQPNRPGPGPGPVRPEPNRPQPQPNRPGPVRPGDRGPVRPGYDPRDRHNIDMSRDRVRNERAMRQLEIDRYNQQRSLQRDQWRRQNSINVYIDYTSIRNADRWMNVYNTWWYDCQRPVYIGAPINWYRPMPAPGMWNYYDVDVVSDNLEYLSRDVYNIMAPVSYSTPNQEYGYRLRDVLARLSNAAENFNDSVDRTYDWSDSLYDLFYLDSVLSETEQTLSGYSQSYRVQSQVSSMRYYVNELLWQYRTNYGY